MRTILSRGYSRTRWYCSLHVATRARSRIVEPMGITGPPRGFAPRALRHGNGPCWRWRGSRGRTRPRALIVIIDNDIVTMIVTIVTISTISDTHSGSRARRGGVSLVLSERIGAAGGAAGCPWYRWRRCRRCGDCPGGGGETAPFGEHAPSWPPVLAGAGAALLSPGTANGASQAAVSVYETGPVTGSIALGGKVTSDDTMILPSSVSILHFLLAVVPR